MLPLPDGRPPDVEVYVANRLRVEPCAVLPGRRCDRDTARPRPPAGPRRPGVVPAGRCAARPAGGGKMLGMAPSTPTPPSTPSPPAPPGPPSALGKPRLSARIAAISESATLAVDARAKAMRAAGRPVISFGAGEPDFPTPGYIVEAAQRACADPRFHKYSPTPGLPELRE